MPLSRQFAILFGIALLGAIIASLLHDSPEPADAKPLADGEISYGNAVAIDPLWVDARSRSEYEVGHLYGALHFDEDRWDASLVALAGAWLARRQPPVVIYCADIACGTSKHLASRLRVAMPDMEVYSLQGGWEATIQP